MSKRRAFVIVLCSTFFLTPVLAQEPEPSDTLPPPDLQHDMELLLEEITQDEEDSQLIDQLTRLAEQSLDLNTAGLEELQQIPDMTPMMAAAIVEFRATRQFNSVDEVLLVEGMTPELFLRMRAFLRVSVKDGDGLPFAIGKATVRSRTVQDIQQRRGFRDGTFLGSPTKIYNRAQMRSTEFDLFGRGTIAELGLLTEKDAGERSTTDFVAGHLHVQTPSLRSRIVMGDFIVEAGQGLVFWRSIGFSKGANVITGPRKSGIGIRPYLSSEENMFFRGVAAQTPVGPFDLSLMYSSKPLHATVSASGTVTSIYTSGLFRTESELRRKGSIQEKLFGARVTTVVMDDLRIGASGYRADFSHPLLLRSETLEYGNQATMVGIDVSYTRRRYSAFSEVAMDKNRSLAGVGGMMYQPHQRVHIALMARAYPKTFLSFHGFGFGESGGALENESGVYVGVRIRLASWWMLSTYYDQFLFPRHSSSIHLSSHGQDYFALSDFRLTRKLTLQFQYKSKQKPAIAERLDAFGRTVRFIDERDQRNYRLTAEFTPSITFRWRSRVELVDVTRSGLPVHEQGILLLQDVRIFPLPKLLLNLRLVVFDTPSFDSRVYAFEHDLPGTFSNPALFGKGTRWYVVGRYEIARWFDLSFKYAQTLKEGVRTISSGTSEIIGDLDNRFSLQIDLVY
jgi:hypothetical protein